MIGNYYDTSVGFNNDTFVVFGTADGIYTSLSPLFPEMNSSAQCPLCDFRKVRPLHQIIPHLVDHHDYPREDIADWLDAL